MIELSNLSVIYPHKAGEQAALSEVSLTISEGESVGIMGANGSGKTTLARCLNGLLLPTSGRLSVDGLDPTDSDNRSEIRRRVGMVFQNPENQIVSTTVEREVAFGLENLGIPYTEMHQIVDDMLAQFDLGQYRQHPPHLLSGGEMQRLAIAAVMAMSPKYIIFDEPTSLLDIPARKMVLSLIHDIHQTSGKRTTLFVTQYPEETLAFDRLLILDRGHVIYDDRPTEVFQHTTELVEIGVSVPAEYEINRFLQTEFPELPPIKLSDFLPIP